ncbi:MAG: hypothetical protein QW360_00595 [Thermofilum sp.]
MGYINANTRMYSNESLWDRIASRSLARKARLVKVVSIDINPNAYELMCENIVLNGVEVVVEARLGNVS